MPSVVVMRPRSDLCWQCQQNSAAIVRTANSAEAEKTAAMLEALEHLRVVKMEREVYKSTCGSARTVFRHTSYQRASSHPHQQAHTHHVIQGT